MKKTLQYIFVFALTILLMNDKLFSQSFYTEDFELATPTATTFTSNGVGFTLTSNFEITTIGPNAHGGSFQLIDNFDNCLLSAGVVGSVKTTSGNEINVKSFWLSPSEDCFSLGTGGNAIIRGKLGGNLKYTITVNSGDWNTNAGSENGFTFVDNSANQNTIIDELEFEVTGALRYIGIDDFAWTENVVPSISNLNGDSGTFTEGGSALILDSGTAASVNDPDATGYNGGSVTASITGASANEDLSIKTGSGVALSAGMTVGSTVTVGATLIGSIASGGTGQDGSNLVVTFNSNATNALIATLLQNLTYTNDSQNPSGSRIVGITVTDALSGTSSTASVTVNLSGTNDDPTLSGKPTDITVTEDVASNVDLSAVIFADVDAGSNSVSFTITAGAGTLTASSGGSVTVSGSGTGTLTLSGTVVNIDTYLNTASNIKYTGTSNANGNDVTTLTLSANDGGATGSGGGGNVSFGTVNVDITAVNDDPAIASLPTDITVTEETESDVDLSSAALSDVDAGASSITLTIAAGAGTLTASSGGSVTVGGSGTGTLTLTGTVSNIDTYLNTASNIKYTGALNASGDNTTTLTLTANDGGATGSGGGGNVVLGTVNVDITGINDDPTITGLPTDITVLEDVASNVDLSAATFGDVDAVANSIKLSIKAGSGTLSVAASGGLSFTGNVSDSITIIGTASNIDTYLNTASNILYTSASNVNGNDVTTLTLVANDQGYTGSGGGSNVTLGTVNVDITAVNDPPVVGNVFGDNSSEVIAGVGAQNVTDLDDATVSNVDSPDYNSGFLTITQPAGTKNGSWGVDGTTVTSGGDGTIAASETVSVGGTSIGTVHAVNDGQGGNDLEFTFNSANATSVNIQTLIRSLTYSAPSGLDARTFTLTLNDNDGTANGGDQDASGNFVITVTPHPPVIGNLNGDNPTIPVGGPAGNIDAGSNATVTDADSPNFNGGLISIVQNTGTSNGNFSLDGTTVTSGGDATIAAAEAIAVSGTSIGTVTTNGQGGNDLVITFNSSNATPARVQTLLRNMKYSAASGSGDRTFTITIKDAASGSNPASGTANITITMSPPEMDLKQGTTAIADAGSYNYGNKAVNSNSDIVFTIHNTAAGVLYVTTPLTLGGADAGQFSIQSQPSANVAANDSTTFTVRFTPTSAGVKTATIAITNSDTDENPYNLTLNGSGNTPPTGGNDDITMNEDATYTFAVSDFTFSDPDTDTFDGIQLQSLETAGALIYDGIDAVTSVDYPDMTKLKFTPASNANGIPYATFTFKVLDNNGGYSTAAYTMTINVTSINEPPEIVINTGSTVKEGESITFTDGMLKSYDEEDASFSLTYIITQKPENGLLTDSIFTQNDIRTGLIAYTHDGSEAPADSFRFVVKDSESSFSAEATFVIAVEGINDLPKFTGVPNFVMNEDEELNISKASLLNFVIDPDDPDSTLVVTLLSNSEEMNITTSDSFFTATSNGNWYGTAQCIFTISDRETTIDTLIYITVQSVNDAPVISIQLIPFSFNEDEEIIITNSELFPFIEDPDNADSTLTITFTYGGENLTIVELSNTSVGIKSIENWFGLDSITVNVSDGLLTANAPFGIIVLPVNDAPVIENLPELITIEDGGEQSIIIWNFVSDVETRDSLLSFEFTPGNDSLNIDFVDSTGLLTLSSIAGFRGETTVIVKVTDAEGGEAEVIITVEVKGSITGIDNLKGIPTDYELSQNFPNPFNPTTKIRYGLPNESKVRIAVYNILGQEIALLKNTTQSAGYHEIDFNARRLSSGLYIYRIQAEPTNGSNKYVKEKKMLMIK